jgi:hypothetical protein
LHYFGLPAITNSTAQTPGVSVTSASRRTNA